MEGLLYPNPVGSADSQHTSQLWKLFTRRDLYPSRISLIGESYSFSCSYLWRSSTFECLTNNMISPFELLLASSKWEIHLGYCSWEQSGCGWHQATGLRRTLSGVKINTGVLRESLLRISALSAKAWEHSNNPTCFWDCKTFSQSWWWLRHSQKCSSAPTCLPYKPTEWCLSELGWSKV